MQIEIKIDEHCTEPKITIVTNKVTDEVNEIMKKLAGEQKQLEVSRWVRRLTALRERLDRRLTPSTSRSRPRNSWLRPRPRRTRVL